jgi:hypothetical protein
MPRWLVTPVVAALPTNRDAHRIVVAADVIVDVIVGAVIRAVIRAVIGLAFG